MMDAEETKRWKAKQLRYKKEFERYTNALPQEAWIS